MSSTARSNQQERRGGTSSRTRKGSHSMHKVNIMVSGGAVNFSGNIYQATPTAPGSFRRNRAGTSNAFTRQPLRHRSSRASRRFDRNSSLQNDEYRQVVESCRFNGTQNAPNVPHMAPITSRTPHLQQHLLPLVPPGSGGVASESRARVEQVEQDASRRADAGRGSVGIQGPLNLDDIMPAEHPRVAPLGELGSGGPMRSVHRNMSGTESTGTLNAFTGQPSRHPSSLASRRFARNASLQVVDQKFHFVLVNTSCDFIEDQNKATDLVSRLGVAIIDKKWVDMPIGNKKMLIVTLDMKDRNRLRNHLYKGEKWATFWCREALLRGEPFLWTYLSEVDLMRWIIVTNWHNHHDPEIDFQVLRTKKDRRSTLRKCFKDPLTFIPLWESLNDHGKRMAGNVASSVGIRIEDVIN